MTPTPRERVRYALSQAHAIGDVGDYTREFENTMDGLITSAISDQTAALQAALEEVHQYKSLNRLQADLIREAKAETAGTSAILYSALEDLARVTKERDAIRDEIRCVRLRAQSAEGLARMAEQRQSRLEMELAASRAGHRTTQGCYETELSARKAAEKERDGLAAATELIGNTLLRVEINPGNYTHDEVCALNDAASTAFQLADHDAGPAALAAHDRQVAARVLEGIVEGWMKSDAHICDFHLMDIAGQYESGEREVPGEL